VDDGFGDDREPRKIRFRILPMFGYRPLLRFRKVIHHHTNDPSLLFLLSLLPLSNDIASSLHILLLYSQLVQLQIHISTIKTSLSTMPSIDWNVVHPSNNPQFAHFPSRRSTVFSTKGLVASSQALASQAGLEILNKGGNAGQW
jgi:hypothetical protein